MQCIHCILMRGGLEAYSIPIKAGGGGWGGGDKHLQNFILFNKK